MLRDLLLAIALGSVACVTSARAQERPGGPERPADADDATDSDAEEVAEGEDFDVVVAELPTYGATARVETREPRELRTRAGTTVTQDEMRERGSRSAPDALRYVPGVSVQQTAHGQASPYIRGVTGQQVLILFDGIRMNNGVYRQGPNQYFFTVDQLTLDHLEVLRGSASTRFGSDAIGGAILAAPIEPLIDPARDGLTVTPRANGRFGSQDLDAGGRLELEAQLGREVGVIAGVGYRTASELQASGPVCNLADQRAGRCDPAAGTGIPMVPRFAPDGRTQRGTGFSYLAFDTRLVWQLAPTLRVVAAVYGFRQFDTPRTDQCPPAFAPESDCLRYVEQFRTMAYLSLRGDAGPELRDLELTMSYQRQFERRELDRPTSYTRNVFRDGLDTLGASFRAASRRFQLAEEIGLKLRFGGEVYSDGVSSQAYTILTNVDIVRQLTRGQYVDGARFAQGGAFLEGELELLGWLRIRAGGRVQLSGVRAQADAESGTLAVRQDFGVVLGRAGVEVRLSPEVGIVANLDQGFRTPNLDDLTSRQQAGPGFQFENASLSPERSLTSELGVRVHTDVLDLEVWGYAMRLENAITRSLRDASDCPPLTPQCNASWSRFQLVNVSGDAWVLGTETALRLKTDVGFGASATFAAQWGEGPNPSRPPSDPTIAYLARVPLSRVPPINGTLEARYAHAETRLVFGAALRWALDQDRLAPADTGDARIPLGGTPGYGIFDLRAGWTFERNFTVHLVFENVFDQAYRVHGSSINGPGRGLTVTVGGSL